MVKNDNTLRKNSHKKGCGKGIGSGNRNNHPIAGRLDITQNLELLEQIQVGDRKRWFVKYGKEVSEHTGSNRFDRMTDEMKLKYCIPKESPNGGIPSKESPNGGIQKELPNGGISSKESPNGGISSKSPKGGISSQLHNIRYVSFMKISRLLQLHKEGKLNKPRVFYIGE